MNVSALEEWITRNNGTPGLLALSLFSPGQTSLVESCTSDLLPQALEKSWRAVTETISVLQLNRFPTARFRFVYANAVVHCERRRDGACLGIFLRKSGSDFAAGELDRLVAEFHAI
jgi:hypothetical protein